MRQGIILLMFALICNFNGNAQDNGNVKKALMDMEQSWAKTLMSGDTNQLKKGVIKREPTSVFIDPSGGYAVWKEMQKVTPVIKFGVAQIDNMDVNVYDNTAVVTYVRTDKGTIDSTPIDGKNRWTDVFVKQKGGWTLVASQGTPVMQQK